MCTCSISRRRNTPGFRSVLIGRAARNDHRRTQSVDRDGSVVMFGSRATNMVTKDTNARPDVFVHDLEQGTTRRTSVTDAGEQVDKFSGYGSVTADGNVATFTPSHAPYREMTTTTPMSSSASWRLERPSSPRLVRTKSPPTAGAARMTCRPRDGSCSLGQVSTSFVPVSDRGGPYLFFREWRGEQPESLRSTSAASSPTTPGRARGDIERRNDGRVGDPGE